MAGEHRGGRTSTGRSAVRALAVIATALIVLLAAAPALGQQDPYTSSTTSPPEEDRPRLRLSLQAGPAGSTIRIRAFGYRPGARVTVTFGGRVVVVATAEAGEGETAGARPGLAAAGLGLLQRLNLAQADDNAGIDETFAVPAVSPGTYPVCVSSAGEETVCADFTVTGQSGIRGVQDSESAGGSNGSNGASRGGSGFARTGGFLLGIAAAGVGAVLLGTFLVMTQRRSRQP
jgi:hypothetical protein